ncbi:MAG TPA: 30S ribosomal protein S3 [Candidatus Brocadiia bacterium]|nr:30S ribosomal protein S3 [Candidatus Brocadiia bacterium]
MGQKVRPTGLRLGITENWRSRWIAPKKEFGPLLVEDQKLRRYIKRHYYYTGLSKIEIERTREQVKVILHVAKPGLIIGRRGAEVDKLRGELEALIGRKVDIGIVEIQKPELEAQLVAEGVAEQLERRASFRRTMKRAAEMTMQCGAKGVKLIISGRLGGAEIARSEALSMGSIPLHTLRADVDYGLAEAHTNYGNIGVKCWIFKGLKDLTSEEQDNGPDAAKS